MAKSFKGGLDSLIGKKPAKGKETTSAPPKRRPGRPSNPTPKVPKDTTEEGTLPGEKRATFIVKEEHLEKLKAIAYWDRVKIKNVLDAALDKHIAAWEKKNGGPVKPVK